MHAYLQPERFHRIVRYFVRAIERGGGAGAGSKEVTKLPASERGKAFVVAGKAMSPGGASRTEPTAASLVDGRLDLGSKNSDPRHPEEDFRARRPNTGIIHL